jgi:5'-nucleotidase
VSDLARPVGSAVESPLSRALPADDLVPDDDLLPGLRVAIDMDGVLADFNTGWMSRYNREFGTQLEASHVQAWDGPQLLTHFDSMREFWTWARGTGRSTFRDAPALEGAVEAANRIATRHRLVIVSSKFPWAIPDSLAWLADHGVRAREVHFLWDKAIAECDVYLDDAPHVLRQLVSSQPRATVCRMVRAWNEPVPGTVDIESWAAFEALVDDLARARAAIGRSRP